MSAKSRQQEELCPSSPRRRQPLPRRKLAVLTLAALLLSMALLAAHAWAAEASWERVSTTTDETRVLGPGAEWGWGFDYGRDSRAPYRLVWVLEILDYEGDFFYLVAGEWTTLELGYDEDRFRTGLAPVYVEIFPGEVYEGPLSGTVERERILTNFFVQNRNWMSEDPALKDKSLTMRIHVQVYKQPLQSLFLQVGDQEWEWWYQPLLLQAWTLTVVIVVSFLLVAYLGLCQPPRGRGGGKSEPPPPTGPGPPEDL